MEKIKHKLVLGESVGQVNQFVSTGAAEVGLTALSTVIKLNPSTWRSIAQDNAPRIEQQFITLNNGKSDEGKVALFVEYLMSPEAHSVLLEWGYELPN